MRTKFLVLAALLATAAEPAHASRKDWATASTIGAIGLGAAGLGVPLVNGDWHGLEQAGASEAIGGGIAFGLKSIIHEERPDGSGDDSFPSAHTSLAFASATTLEIRYGWRIGIPAYLVASFVGVARVEARKHHWYDAVAGAGIGTLSGVVITRRRDDDVRLVPWGDSHGGGMSLSAQF